MFFNFLIDSPAFGTKIGIKLFRFQYLFSYLIFSKHLHLSDALPSARYRLELVENFLNAIDEHLKDFLFPLITNAKMNQFKDVMKMYAIRLRIVTILLVNR